MARQPIQNAAQHMARIEIIGGAVQLIKSGQELRGLRASPRGRNQSAGDGADMPICIAIFPDKASFFGIAARNVDNHGRAGKEPPIFVNGQNLMPPQPLAARDATHIGEDNVDGIHIGMGGKKGLCLSERSDLMRRLGVGHAPSFQRAKRRVKVCDQMLDLMH